MTVQWNPDAVIAKVHAATIRAVTDATEEIAEVGTVLINSPPKTGRIYRRGGVEHQASAPGEAPAADTGNLAANVETSVADERSQVSGLATWNADYAAFLESGTMKMAPRPFARPALDQVAPGLAAAVQGEIDAALA